MKKSFGRTLFRGVILGVGIVVFLGPGPGYSSDVLGLKERDTLPEFQEPVDPPGLSLPPVQRPQGQKKLSEALTVDVRGFRFQGNTVFSDQELTQVAAPYENRLISSSELHELRYTLSEFYVRQGYINSGAILPDQRVENGVITFRIVEGSLTRVEISGHTGFRESFLAERLQPDDDRPLNIRDLQERLQLLHQSPLIKQINAELLPGLTPGQAILKAKVREEKPYFVRLGIGNDRSPSVGGIRSNVELGWRNLSGLGDVLRGEYGVMDGAEDYEIRYSLPLNAGDTTLELFGSETDAEIVEEPFDLMDIDSRTSEVGFTLSHPLIRQPARELTLSLGGAKRRNVTTLLSEPYSFALGAKDGVSVVTVAQLSLDWLVRQPNQVLAARSEINLGLDLFDSTINPSGPDSQFLTWLGQFQWARRLELVKGDQLIFKTDVQLAADPLLPLQKFSIGGAGSVRGYRENLLIADNGVVASLEYRMPLLRLPIPGHSLSQSDGMVQLAPFMDWGVGWNTGWAGPVPTNISSLGIGLRWDPTPAFHTHIYAGKGLRNVEHDEHDPQDSGIHVLVSWDVF